ncbi:hypothetical protein F5Y16DRAFT_406690 [Xylariaceae sp. FL0255]|nr:hypothetical protein F5Y16DRAFT_406690 [Xylariaceae sp. FL0255]
MPSAKTIDALLEKALVIRGAITKTFEDGKREAQREAQQYRLTEVYEEDEVIDDDPEVYGITNFDPPFNRAFTKALGMTGQACESVSDDVGDDSIFQEIFQCCFKGAFEKALHDEAVRKPFREVRDWNRKTMRLFVTSFERFFSESLQAWKSAHELAFETNLWTNESKVSKMVMKLVPTAIDYIDSPLQMNVAFNVSQSVQRSHRLSGARYDGFAKFYKRVGSFNELFEPQNSCSDYKTTFIMKYLVMEIKEVSLLILVRGYQTDDKIPRRCVFLNDIYLGDLSSALSAPGCSPPPPRTTAKRVILHRH